MSDKPRYDGIDLETALDSLGTAFELDVDALIEAAYEDPHGGYHASYDDGFPIGSIWRVEGQVLYALCRVLKPERVLEIGTFHGCSATHIAQALKDNGSGMLTCVDKDGRAGDLIPPDLIEHIEFVAANFADYLPSDTRFDLVFEDGDHTPGMVEMVWRAAYGLLKPGGVMVSHDAEHFVVGSWVREGIMRAGFFGAMPPARSLLIAPSDCGLAVWRKLPAQTLDYVPQDEDLPFSGDEPETVDEPQAWTAHDMALEDMTVASLKEYAQSRGIDVPSRITKAELIQLIEDDL